MRTHDKKGRAIVSAVYDSLPLFARIFIQLRLIILPLEEIEPSVPSGAIADIGCGYGILAYYLAHTNKERTVTGFERNIALVSRADKIALSCGLVRFVQDDAESIVLGKYDGIVLCDILHHLSPQGQEYLVRTAGKALNPRGRIIIKEIEKERNIFYYWNLFHDRVMRLSGPTFHRTAEEWVAMVERQAMRLIEKRHCRYFLYHHIIIVAERA